MPRSAAKLSVVLPVLLLTGAAVALGSGACGGSSSESPWPVEPEGSDLGPAGEEGKQKLTDGTPDAGPDAAPNVEP